jgi:hypothetical protein
VAYIRSILHTISAFTFADIFASPEFLIFFGHVDVKDKICDSRDSSVSV